MSQLRKCVNMAPLNSASVVGRDDLDPTSSGAAVADYRRADVRAFFSGSSTTHVRMFADWFDIEGIDKAEGANIASIRQDIVTTLDRNIAQARADGKIVVLCARSYPSWVNNSYTIDPFYSSDPTVSGRPGPPPAGHTHDFNLLNWQDSLPDRASKAAIAKTGKTRTTVVPSELTAKGARFRFPGNAMLGADQPGSFNVAAGSDFAFWMTFLLARYHPDRRLLGALTSAEIGHYAALLGPRPGPLPPVLPPPPAGAVIQYFEFVNEPNSFEGWPQQTPAPPPADNGFGAGRLIADKVVADMFATVQGVAFALIAKSAALGGTPPQSPTLLGPASSDQVGGSLVSELLGRGSGSTRTVTTCNTFALALLNELRGANFDPTTRSGVAIGFSQHNYTDIERARVGGIVASAIDANSTNAAALTQRILRRRAWRGIGGPLEPQLFLTEGAARLNNIAKLYRGVNAQTKQAALINAAWTEMSHQTTGRRLGRGVAMFSQFLFYTLPPGPPPFDCGLCGLPFRDASGREPVPADNGASRRRPSYTTWAGLSGTTTGTPEAP